MKIISSKSIYAEQETEKKRKEALAAARKAAEEAEKAAAATRPATAQPARPTTAQQQARPAATRPATAQQQARPATARPTTAQQQVRPAATRPATAQQARPAATRPATAQQQARPATARPATAQQQVRPATARPATAQQQARPAAARPATAQQQARPAAARPETAQQARPATTRPTTAQQARPTAVRTTTPVRKPTVPANGAQPRQTRPASSGTMAESAARRRAAQSQTQTVVREAEPRVRAGFVEESPVRPARPRPAPAKTKRRRKRKKKKSFGSRLARFTITLLVLFAMYLTAVFSNVPFIAKWRTIYIQTAMNTMHHQWLATAFIPHSVIDKVMTDMAASREAQIGVNSQWGDDVDEIDPATGEKKHRNPTLTDTKGMTDAEIAFFDQFWEVDVQSMLDYVREKPEALADGWDKIDINHSALNDSGTTIRTVQDEQVLAIDAQEGTIIIRQSGAGYRGVMAVCKDPSRLSLQAAASIGSFGEVAGDIANAHNGVIAMTGSGFIDVGGVGNGGSIVGYAMCNGMSYGSHMAAGYKRLELRQDNRIYIVDASAAVHPDTTDCVEFSPAMIIDGEIVVDATSGFTDLQPRACIGQSKYGEIIMLLIEGRLPTVSLGLGVPECARIMSRHECAQAMNLDGGTSAMIWYKGEYIMKSSNPVLSAGRTLPNAFVYESAN